METRAKAAPGPEDLGSTAVPVAPSRAATLCRTTGMVCQKRRVRTVFPECHKLTQPPVFRTWEKSQNLNRMKSPKLTKMTGQLNRTGETPNSEHAPCF